MQMGNVCRDLNQLMCGSAACRLCRQSIVFSLKVVLNQTAVLALVRGVPGAAGR